MGQVIPMIHTSSAKARGIADAVAIAATRLGVSPERAVIMAKAASLSYLGGKKSAARVVADATAELRRDAPKASA